MLTLQCTKKLAAELKVTLANEKQTISSSLYSWHAHLFLSNRRKCVLLMNNETRYNFVLYGLKREDIKRFEQLVSEKIVENLLADGIEQSLVDKYFQLGLELSYAPTSDRSILGQINEMIMVAKDELEANISETNDPTVEQVNRLLNRYIYLYETAEAILWRNHA